MPAATILFTDIVQFSGKPSSQQKELIEKLTGVVESNLRSFLAKNELIPLPTGDGMALAFVATNGQTWDVSTVMNTIYELQCWARDTSAERLKVSLRIGVHIGQVELITDIRGSLNICGHSINRAQRVMDSANPRQVLLSDEAYHHHIGSETQTYKDAPFSEQHSALFSGPIEVHSKHDESILVYKVELIPSEEWWSNEDPAAKNVMLVRLTDLPKEIVGTFSNRIKEGKDIAFVQLTGDRFLDAYSTGDIVFSKNLQSFSVFMPDPDIYRQMQLDGMRASPDYVLECIGRWKGFFEEFKKDYDKADLNLCLFDEPPFFGASYIDWERQNGQIHVSPYVWNIEAPQCPGYDLKWVGIQPSPVYEKYVRGLRHLQATARSIL